MKSCQPIGASSKSVGTIQQQEGMRTMCGRYTLKTPVNVLAERFQLDEYPSSLTPSYNIAPTQEVAAVVQEDDRRKLELFHWGLIPSWAKDPGIGKDDQCQGRDGVG